MHDWINGVDCQKHLSGLRLKALVESCMLPLSAMRELVTCFPEDVLVLDMTHIDHLRVQIEQRGFLTPEISTILSDLESLCARRVAAKRAEHQHLLAICNDCRKARTWFVRKAENPVLPLDEVNKVEGGGAEERTGNPPPYSLRACPPHLPLRRRISTIARRPQRRGS